MKSYKVIKPGEFALEALNDTVCAENYAKVKILKAGVSNTDLNLYRGTIKGANYPLSLSHQAMGVVSETAEGSGLSKSERVFINPYLKCGTCISCLEGTPQCCENLKMMGIDSDGLLADFVIVPVENLHRLPDILDPTRAMFIEYTALAKTAIDKLKIIKGEHVAIVGASKLGNIIAQLVIYYQGVPILIDDNDDMLSRAAENGIYYTINTKTQDAKKIIKDITGNRMAENVIHIANSTADINLSMALVGCNGFMVIAGGEKNQFSGSFLTILEKQLRVTGVHNGYENISSAINLLANKTVNISNLLKENIPFSAVPEKFKEWAEQEIFHFQITVDC